MFKFLQRRKRPSKQPFQLSDLIEILQDGVCITRETGEIIYINKAGYQMLGIDLSADLGGLNFFDQIIRDNENLNFFQQKLRDTGIVQNYEIKLCKLSGDGMDAIVNVNLIGDFSNQTIGYLFLLKDVTELKKIQAQLLQSQKLESIGLMASGIAHDFNNILAAIIPNSELIKYSLNEEEENYKRAEIIEKSALRASDIAQRLLTFTRHRDQQFTEIVELNQIVGDSIELLKPTLPDNIRIHLVLASGLPRMEADGAQLQQIVMNLVINAKDAMADGGTINIFTNEYRIKEYYQLGSLKPGLYLRLRVEDSGSGIPVELQPKIFDPFFTTKEIGKGTGLGLSVVYGIVKSLNGHIEVKSEAKGGTIFDLYFPAVSVAREPESEEPAEINQNRPVSIMIIDDEDNVLNILGDILVYLGYNVKKFNNGFDGIDYYRENFEHIDFVIVDMKMPKMDGRATSSELSEINPDIKLIFTSGFDDTSVNQFDSDKVVGFLKKPYSIKQISLTLEKIIGRQEPVQ